MSEAAGEIKDPGAQEGSQELPQEEPSTQKTEEEPSTQKTEDEPDTIVQTTEESSAATPLGASGESSSSAVSLGYTSYIALFAVAALMIGIGTLGLNIYNACPDKGPQNLNHSIASFALGMGIGIIVFIVLNLVMSYSSRITLVILSLFIIITASINIRYTDAGDLSALRVLNVALIGLGAGLFVTFLFTMLPTGKNTIRILTLLLAIAVIVFSSANISMYNGCGKNPESSSSYGWSVFLLIAAILIAVLIALSFWIMPF